MGKIELLTFEIHFCHTFRYGYVLLSVVFLFGVLLWMGIKVSMARKEHDVPYPIMVGH